MLSCQYCLKMKIVYHKSVCRQSARIRILPSYDLAFHLGHSYSNEKKRFRFPSRDDSRLGQRKLGARRQGGLIGW